MDWLSDFAQWLLDTLLYVPRWVWNELLIALASVITAIPVPSFVLTWSANASSLPSSVIWFLSLLEFKAGLAMVASAYVLRWLLRRIPLVG